VPQVPDHVRRLRSLQPPLVPVRVRCALALRGRVGGYGTGRWSRFAHTVLVDMTAWFRRAASDPLLEDYCARVLARPDWRTAQSNAIYDVC
jgi:hypothetical protein